MWEVWCKQASENRKEMQGVQGRVPLENNEVVKGILKEAFTPWKGRSHSRSLPSFPFFLFVFFFSPKFMPFPRAPASWAQEEGESEREVLLLKTYS